jgi:chaperone modulatory protein CbpM
MQRHEFLMHAEIEGARLICDLQRGLGVNDEAVPIILHLLDQVHGLRRMIAEARRRATDPQDG